MARGKVRGPALTKPITMTVVALDNCTSAVANARDANASIGLSVNCTSACRSESPANALSPSVNSAIPSRNKPADEWKNDAGHLISEEIFGFRSRWRGPGSIPVDRGDSRLRRHALGGNNDNLAAFFEDQLAEVVEHVVNFRVR